MDKDSVDVYFGGSPWFEVYTGGRYLCFLHADLAPDETVYVAMPLGFNTKSKNGKRQVLKLNKTLYGLCQSPRAFW